VRAEEGDEVVVEAEKPRKGKAGATGSVEFVKPRKKS
jgi:hypothetical protein